MKQLVQNVAKALGYKIYRLNSPETDFSDPFQVMRRLINNPRPIVFDVGANIGQSAERFRSIFPESHVFSFEPFPASFERLSSTFKDDPAVESYQLALADAPAISKLTVNQSVGTNSLLASDSRSSYYWGPNRLNTQDEIEVETDTVDRFAERKAITHLDILKLDVQGAEFAVLEGARQMLSSQRIDLIYMEMITAPTYIGQRKLHEYLALLDSFQYELFDYYNPRRKRGRLIQTDNIIVSSEFLHRHEQLDETDAT